MDTYSPLFQVLFRGRYGKAFELGLHAKVILGTFLGPSQNIISILNKILQRKLECENLRVADK